jgi:hypothetical protein
MPCSVILPVAKVCWKPGTLDSSLVESKDPSVHCMLATREAQASMLQYVQRTYVCNASGRLSLYYPFLLLLTGPFDPAPLQCKMTFPLSPRTRMS